MRKSFLKLFSVILTLSLVFTFCQTASAAAPANPNANSAARELLDFIYSISGSYTVAGQHDKPSYPTETYNRVFELTGKYPGLWGGDFGFSSGPNDTIYNREALVNEAIAKWRQGSIPAWTWHMVRPDMTEPNDWNSSVLIDSNAENLRQMTTPGTELYNCFINRIDSVVWAFQALEDAGVPVLWRPFHEMNDYWFWWGGNTTYSPQLYRIMHDRFTDHWGLDNIIWVWNVDRPFGASLAPYYPGDDYVDILSMDIYSNDYNQNYYQQMLDLAHGKPIALAEVGEMPSPEVLAAQPEWAYFMCWTEFLEGNNNADYINRVYSNERTLDRSRMPFAPQSAERASVKIEAEDYSNMYGINVENCSEGGSDIGSIDQGDWLSYNVTLPVSEVYRVEFRVAAPNAGGIVRLEKSGGEILLGTADVPATGDWQNWVTVYTDAYFSAGSQSFGIKAATGGYNLNYIKFTPLSIWSESTEPEPQELQIDTVAADGTSITVTAHGGDGALLYSYYILSEGRVVFSRAYDENSSVTLENIPDGNYTVRVYVQDANKTRKVKTEEFTV